MTHYNRFKFSSADNSPKQEFTPLYSTANLIVVYIVLFLLTKMRAELGLEAMLDYMRRYMEKLETSQPDLKSHIHRTLRDVDIEKMYKETLT